MALTKAKILEIMNSGSFDGGVTGNADAKHKLVTCALRNTAGVWAVIDNDTHRPINVASVTSDTSKITVTYNFTASKVCGFACGPDETYIADDITFGASVGVSAANIYARISKTISGYISYGGSAWDISKAPGVVSAVWDTDKLVITHGSLYQDIPNIYNASVTHRGGVHVAELGGVGPEYINVEFYDFTGTKITTPNTNMKFFFEHSGHGAVDPTILTQWGSNIWAIGLFEV